MNAIKAELLKIKFELINKKYQNILIFFIVGGIYTYNIISRKFMFDAGAYDRLMLTTIFQNLIIIKSIMGALAYPFVELDKHYNQNGQFFNYPLSKQLPETFLSIRIIAKSFTNSLILTTLILITNLSIGVFSSPANYIFLLLVIFVGQFSLFGIGMFLSSLFLALELNRAIVSLLNVILLILFMFVGSNNYFIPYVLSKFLVFDTLYSEIVSGVTKNISLNSAGIVLLNSIIYFSLGYISILLSRIYKGSKRIAGNLQ